MRKTEKKIIGTIDKVDLPLFNIENIEAKIDTGASRSSLHCKGIRLKDDGLHFKIPFETGVHEFSTPQWIQKKIRSSNGKAELRYIIKTKLRVFSKNYLVSFSLTDRSKMKYPMLIGKSFLKNRFIVDVAEKNLSYKEKISK